MIANATQERTPTDETRVVLVAERDSRTRGLEEHFLSGPGVLVHSVADGQSALDAARRLAPAVVVTEILIPKLDGLALCRRLKARGDAPPPSVVVVSVLAAGARAREAGADAFLLKPISEGRLVAAVHGLLAASERPWR